MGCLYCMLITGPGFSVLCNSSLLVGHSYGGESAYTARSCSGCSRNPYCYETVSFFASCVAFIRGCVLEINGNSVLLQMSTL
jgi:hypothetical protein